MHLFCLRCCEFGRQRWGEVQLRVALQPCFDTHALLMLAHAWATCYTFIYNPVILTILLSSEEAMICEEFFLHMHVHLERRFSETDRNTY